MTATWQDHDRTRRASRGGVSDAAEHQKCALAVRVPCSRLAPVAQAS